MTVLVFLSTNNLETSFKIWFAVSAWASRKPVWIQASFGTPGKRFGSKASLRMLRSVRTDSLRGRSDDGKHDAGRYPQSEWISALVSHDNGILIAVKADIDCK
jgi:hypothetical protein